MKRHPEGTRQLSEKVDNRASTKLLGEFLSAAWSPVVRPCVTKVLDDTDS